MMRDFNYSQRYPDSPNAQCPTAKIPNLSPPSDPIELGSQEITQKEEGGEDQVPNHIVYQFMINESADKKRAVTSFHKQSLDACKAVTQSFDGTNVSTQVIEQTNNGTRTGSKEHSSQVKKFHLQMVQIDSRADFSDETLEDKTQTTKEALPDKIFSTRQSPPPKQLSQQPSQEILD